MKRILVFVYFFLLQISCSHLDHLERSEASGYGPQTKPGSQPSSMNQTQYKSTPKEMINAPLNYKLMGDMGLSPEALKDPELKRKYDLQYQIKSKEKYLTDDRDKKQYYNALPWFKNNDERLEFLEQPGYEARWQWMRNHNFGKRSTEADEEMAELIDKKDIALGMSQDWVKRSWGTPDSIDVAGNPIYKNERWKYKKYISSIEGFKLQKRMIYFEGGKVVGWEQLDE